MAEYKSLYHYLGKPAGGELGRKVANEATVRGLKLEKLEVNKDLVPSGFVYTYPVDFLDDFFNNSNSKSLDDRVKALEEKVNMILSLPSINKKHLIQKDEIDDLPF
jgi:hypothetical protein